MVGIAGVVMAGGQSRRMGGGDKCLRLLGGRPILDRILERAAPQVGPLLLNANGEPGRFSGYGLPVRSDAIGEFAGPLAGILTGLEWAREDAPDCAWLASFACDAPFLPEDLVLRLQKAVEENNADLACARSRGRSHPVFGLWRVDLARDLRNAMEEEGIRKVDIWTGRHKLVEVEFEDRVFDEGTYDPFFNTNRPEDLEAAAQFL